MPTLQSTHRFNVSKHADMQKIMNKHLNPVSRENANEFYI